MDSASELNRKMPVKRAEDETVEQPLVADPKLFHGVRAFVQRKEKRNGIAAPQIVVHPGKRDPVRSPALAPATSGWPFGAALTASLPLPTRVAVVGNHLPRQCGIATFTTDLCAAIVTEFEMESLFAVPVNDPHSHYDYPERVRLEIVQDDVASYRRAAEFLNFNGNDVVCLQHEYGIFGGRAGSHILTLLRALKMPVMTTLHTVLRNPDADQRAVLAEVASLSDRLIVMSERSSRMLRDIYEVPESKIDLIPHGIPDLPFIDPSFYKDRFGTEGRSVLLTFGLLSPNKGIENVIRALPAILSTHKNVVYVVAGATHPHIKRREGDWYRAQLHELAKRCGVSANVLFDNRFMTPEEMIESVGSADIYITPYRHEEQVVSGTLAMAVGAGKAIISTPYWHASELLADNRGVIVPFDDPGAVAGAAIALLDHDAERNAMRKRAYLYARNTVWKKTAQAYMASFQRGRADRISHPHPAVAENVIPIPGKTPPLKIDHLLSMTDDTGMLQHAVYSLPNCLEGYTTDDNARALIVALLLGQSEKISGPEHFRLSRRYLGFLWLAFAADAGRFRNFLSYQRTWLEETGSEDCHGRALWALGYAIARSSDTGIRRAAGRLFEPAAPAVLDFRSPRAWAYAVLGFEEYLERFPEDRAIRTAQNVLAERLVDIYDRSHSGGWRWFEGVLSYANARLAQAVLTAGRRSANERMIRVGLESLEWLCREQHVQPSGHFVPIGSRGFFRKGGEKARFDQQPVDACATVSACLAAYRIGGDTRWLHEARSAFRWFLGENDLEAPLYDAETGGCRDGLHPDRVNENQGAESTLSFLMARLEIERFETPRTSPGKAPCSV